MNLKEIKLLTTLNDIKSDTKSKRNRSDMEGICNISFSEEEKLSETNIDDNPPTKDIGEPMFDEVTTLDWIKTWRALQIN